MEQRNYRVGEMIKGPRRMLSPAFTLVVFGWVGVLVAMLLLPGYGTSLLIGVGTTTAIYVLLGSGAALFAYLGSFTFGIGGFVAISAYVLAYGDSHGWPLRVSEAVAMALPCAVSWLVAPLFFRLKGIYFALVSFAFAALLQQIAVGWTSVTGGTQGISFVVQRGPIPWIGNSPRTLYLSASVCAALAIVALTLFRRSKAGKQAVALGGDIVLARSLGIRPGKYQRRLSAAGGLLGGIAGIFYVFQVGFVVPDEFGTELSLIPVAAIIVGGVRFPIAPALGAILIVFLPQAFGLSPFAYTILYALVLVVVMLAAPDGLVEGIGRLARWLLRYARSRKRTGPGETKQMGVPDGEEPANEEMRQVNRAPSGGFERTSGGPS